MENKNSKTMENKNLKPIIVKEENPQNTLKNLRNIIAEANQNVSDFEQDRNIKFTAEELESLTRQILNVENIIARNDFKSLPPEFRDMAKTGLRDALNSLNQRFSRFKINVKGFKEMRDFIEIKDGKFAEKKSAEADIKKLLTLLIDEPEKLALYHEAVHIAKRMEEISAQLDFTLHNIWEMNSIIHKVYVEADCFANYSNY